MEVHRLLVIEDDADIQGLYSEAFESYPDTRLEYVSSGTQAVPLLVEHRYAAIIMDLKLPGINGLQLISYAKENVNRRTPIFIISGFLSDSVIVVAQNLGVVETIEKPFDPDAVAKKIHARMLEGDQPLYYDAKLTRTFIAAANDIFLYYFGAFPVVGVQQINPARVTSRNIISGIISITGRNFVGTMALTVESAVIKDMAAALFPEAQLMISKGFAADILGVLCYQIMGKIKEAFGHDRREATVCSPTVIIGKDHLLFHKTTSPLFSIPLTIKQMHCELEFYFDTIHGQGAEQLDWLFSTTRSTS